ARPSRRRLCNWFHLWQRKPGRCSCKTAPHRSWKLLRSLPRRRIRRSTSRPEFLHAESETCHRGEYPSSSAKRCFHLTGTLPQRRRPGGTVNSERESGASCRTAKNPTPRPSKLREKLPGEYQRGQYASCASCLLFASRATCACA